MPQHEQPEKGEDINVFLALTTMRTTKAKATTTSWALGLADHEAYYVSADAARYPIGT